MDQFIVLLLIFRCCKLEFCTLSWKVMYLLNLKILIKQYSLKKTFSSSPKYDL